MDTNKQADLDRRLIAAALEVLRILVADIDNGSLYIDWADRDATREDVARARAILEKLEADKRITEAFGTPY